MSFLMISVLDRSCLKRSALEIPQTMTGDQFLCCPSSFDLTFLVSFVGPGQVVPDHVRALQAKHPSGWKSVMSQQYNAASRSTGHMWTRRQRRRKSKRHRGPGQTYSFPFPCPSHLLFPISIVIDITSIRVQYSWSSGKNVMKSGFATFRVSSKWPEERCLLQRRCCAEGWIKLDFFQPTVSADKLKYMFYHFN